MRHRKGDQQVDVALWAKVFPQNRAKESKFSDLPAIAQEFDLTLTHL
jgi:hypothetical protein